MTTLAHIPREQVRRSPKEIKGNEQLTLNELLTLEETLRHFGTIGGADLLRSRLAAERTLRPQSSCNFSQGLRAAPLTDVNYFILAIPERNGAG